MALSPTEESLVRQLIAQNPALLNLASSESTIISKLGATKVSLSDLSAATSLSDADLALVRQGLNDKSFAMSVLRDYVAANLPVASTTTKGIVELATNTETQTGTDATRAVTPAGLKSIITTSATDTTAGRVLKVGDWGIGGDLPVLSGGDLLADDDYYEYYITAATNAPAGAPTTSGYVKKETRSSSFRKVTFTPFNLSTGPWVNVCNNGVWAGWVELYHSGNLPALGVGQTWQDLTASRSGGVTYTNTTGRPIQIAITCASGTNVVTTIDGVERGQSSGGSVSTGSYIVPNGSTYSANVSGPYLWHELR